MSQVMKTFTGVFMVLFLVVTSTGVLGAFCQILHAQNTHAVMIDELENSDYTKSVMEACFETAEQEGLHLQLNLYSDTEEIEKCLSKAELPESTEMVSMVEVLLNYSIEIPFLDVNVEQQLFGYAR